MLEFVASYYSISALVIAVVSLWLGILVFVKRPKDEMNQSLTLWCLIVAIWAFFYFLWQIETDGESALLWTRLLMVGAIWVPVSYLNFVSIFLGIKKQKKNLLRVFFYMSVVFTVLLPTGLMVNKVEPAGGFQFWPKPGLAFTPFLLMFVGITIYAAVISYRALKSNEYLVRRVQIKYLLFSIALAIIGGSTNYFLWYDIPIKPYGNILVLSYVVVAVYIILRYRMFGFRVVVRKSALHIIQSVFSFLYLGLIIALIRYLFVSLVSLEALVVGFIAAVVFVFIFDRFRNWLEAFSSKYFLTGIYSYHATLRKVGEDLSNVVSLKKIVKTMVASISQAMGVEDVYFLLHHGKEDFRLEQVKGVPFSGRLTSVQLKELSVYLADSKKAAVEEELRLMADDTSDDLRRSILLEIANEIKSLGVSVVLPMIVRGKLRGLILLGPKASKDAFTSQDIELLETASGQAAIAIENARLYYGMEQEVSERTLELREANQRLEDLLEVKSEFLDIASHQLRTPTSIIRGMLSMVVDGSAGKQEKEFIYDSFQASERLTVIINDLLDATELEGKEMKVELKEVSLFELLEKSVKLFEKPAQTKGIDLIFKPAPNLRTSPLLRLDTDRFRSAVENLIDNSVKYTRVGSVTVSARQTPNQVFITVKDTGIGVHKDDLGKLFQKFSRGEDASKMAPNGSGLGLFIAKKIVEAHDGKIEASSPGRGEGTSFLITLPVMS